MYSPTVAHTALRARSRFAMMPFLCHSTKKWQKKRNQGVPPWIPPPPAVLTMNGGAFAVSKLLHLRGIHPTPQMRLLLARFFAVCGAMWAWIGCVRVKRKGCGRLRYLPQLFLSVQFSKYSISFPFSLAYLISNFTASPI